MKTVYIYKDGNLVPKALVEKPKPTEGWWSEPDWSGLYLNDYLEKIEAYEADQQRIKEGTQFGEKLTEFILSAQRIKKESKWISVDNELPKNGDCLFLNANGLVGYGFFKDGIFENYLNEPLFFPVVKWQPLPSAPTKQ